VRRHGAPLAIALLGLAVFALALAADTGWFDRHFLPSFFLPRAWYLLIYKVVRWSVAAAGLLLAVAARRLAAWLTLKHAARAVPIVVAAALGLAAGELVLRGVHLQPTGWLRSAEEPRRRPDATLGWTLEPGRAGRGTIGGREIEYALDSNGYRVQRPGAQVDVTQPTVVFAGESVMFGEGLSWEDSIPAQVGTLLHIQTANMAVHGFSSDQTYLRLQQELPRFQRPLAVVSLFMTALFGRNLDDDRPRLLPGLTWRPAEEHGRLVSLAGLIVPYRRDRTVEQGIAVTREVLQATVALAKTRGATPLVLVPQLGVENEAERALRQRIFDGTDVPYELAVVDAVWRLPWDRHPNASAARAIATAVAHRLQEPSLHTHSSSSNPQPVSH